jgi:hypothetical protein
MLLTPSWMVLQDFWFLTLFPTREILIQAQTQSYILKRKRYSCFGTNLNVIHWGIRLTVAPPSMSILFTTTPSTLELFSVSK